MIPNPYNMSQWNWIADRFEEGYRVSEIADFIGMNPNNVYENLCSVGRRTRPEERIPLDERKREFNALANDGSPRIDNYYVRVVGVDVDGNEVHFNCVREAERSLGIPYGQIRNSIKRNYRCYGYKWREEK